MLWSESKSSENEQVQGALRKINPLNSHLFPLSFYKKKIQQHLSKYKGRPDCSNSCVEHSSDAHVPACYPSRVLRPAVRNWPRVAYPIPKLNALQKLHALQDGFQIDAVLLVPKCVMSEKVDVLPSDGRYPH